MGNEKKVRLAFFFTLLGIASAAIIYNDIIYIQNKPLLVTIEVLRILLAIPIVMAILVYFSEKRLQRFEFYAKLSLISVYAFDIIIALTRPRDSAGGFFFSIGLLLLGYFLPLENKKFRNKVALTYSVILAILILVVKTSHLPTELVILAMLACINAIGIALPSMKVPPLKTAEVILEHEAEPAGEAESAAEAEARSEKANFDYLSQLKAKIEDLPLTDREKEVTYHILQGKSRSEIAATLYLSEETIKKHTANIYTKLDISSHSELFKAVLG